MPVSKKFTLREWREKHFAQMDKNILVWEEIRDNPTCAARDRNEAAKNIARALGTLAPDKVTKSSGGSQAAQHDALTPKEDAMIESIINGIKKQTD